MSSISSLFSDGYFSLKNESTSTSTSTDTTKAAAPSLADALASLNTTSSTATNADSVSLSPEAQAYLDALHGTSTGSTSSSTGGNDQFTLTKAQQQTLDAILAKYKDSPFTYEVFGQIQKDLDSAGISPDVLNAQDQMRSFNPTQFMLDALNGTDGGTLGTLNTDNNGAVKSNNYLKSVAEQWSNISTTISQTEA